MSKSESPVPPAASSWRIIPTLLVLTGAIPFIVSAMAIFRFDHLLDIHAEMGVDAIAFRLQLALISLLLYGAVILSFLGGIRWGIELGKRPDEPNWVVLTLSVLGSLLAWLLVAVGAMIKTDHWLLWIFAGAFGFHLWWDVWSSDLPRWFKRLRFTASAVAMGAFMSVSILFL